MPRPKIIAVIGPTAIGKSDLAVILAKKLGGEVISADSRQVYKGLNIGTGKITDEEMGGIPHYMLDIENPKNTFTANDFVELGTKAIEYITAKGKIPIICGGTGFYVDNLLAGTTFAEVKADPKLRAKLEKKSLTSLLAELMKLDPKRAKTIDQKNKRRIIRAIEIARSLGNVPKLKAVRNPYDVLYIGLTTDRSILRERIMQRLLRRIDSGMLGEARALHKKGLTWKRMESLGLEYRYMALHLQKKISKDQMIQKLHTEICRYAKRQMTWFKRNKKINWFDTTKKQSQNDVRKLVTNFLGR